jgi:hypothetical protein
MREINITDFDAPLPLYQEPRKRLTVAHRTTCVEDIRTMNRQRAHRGWWADKRWKAYVKNETAGKTCKYCGCHGGDIIISRWSGKPHKAHLTIHHTADWGYVNFDVYCDPNTPHEIVCNDCHRHIEKGEKLCTRCGKNWISWDSEICTACKVELDPGFLEKVEAGRQDRQDRRRKREHDRRAKATRKRHPCARRRTNQWCAKGGACPHNARNAPKCPRFLRK